MSKSITVHTQLDKQLLSKGVGEILSNNLVMKYAWLIGLTLIITSGILFVYVFKVQSYAPMIGLFCGTFFLFFKNIMAFFSVQKLAPDDMTYEKLTYKFSSKEIDIKGETFTAKLFWENIKNVKETKEFFLIFQKTLAANIVPKSSFTVEQLTSFRTLLQSINNIDLDIEETN